MAVPIFTGNGEFQVPGSRFQVAVFPNPFSEIVHIEFEIANPSLVCIQVFNATGQKVADIQEEFLPKGKHSISQNTDHWPPGMYVCRASSRDEIVTRKIIKY